jgi:hypothetical protein
LRNGKAISDRVVFDLRAGSAIGRRMVNIFNGPESGGFVTACVALLERGRGYFIGKVSDGSFDDI